MAALLLGNLAFAALPLIVCGVIAVVLVLRARRRTAALVAAGGAPGPGAGAARVIGVLAFVYGLLSSFAVFGALVVTISMTVQSVQGGEGGSAMTLRIPAGPDTAIPDALLPATNDGLDIGYFSEISFTAVGISPGAQLLFFAPVVLTPLLHAIVAFGIASLASRIEKNEGFAPQLTRTAVVVGSALIVIGTLSQALRSVGEGLARNELLGSTPLEGFIAPEPFDLTPIAAGIAVLLVGMLMRRGERLQRDTAGLV